MKQKFSARKTAVAALLAALGTVILILGSVSETMSLTVAALAALPVLLLTAEYGTGYAAACYAAVAILALVLSPMKEGALEFACFFGFYPMVKNAAERRPRTARIAIKALSLLLATAAYAGATMLFFTEDITWLGTWYYVALPILTAICFLLYDRMLAVLLRLYGVKLRNKIARYL